MATEELGLELVVEGFNMFDRQMGKLDDTISRLDDGFDVLSDSVNSVSDAIDAMSAEVVGALKPLGDAGDKTRQFGDDAERASGGVSILAVTVGNVLADAVRAAASAFVELGRVAAGAITGSVEAAIDYESAFAGVTKTTDGLTDSVGNLTEAGVRLKSEFRELAQQVPVSFEELTAIAELGGQLGVAEADLIGFTETIAALGVTTNLTTEEAATSFAQMANIMGISTSSMGQMGDVAVALGNNFATTERDIVNFAQNIAGAGKIAGLTTDEVFAIGAAMSSVGIEAAAGGTAVQKVLLGMNEAAMGATGSIIDNSAAITQSSDKLKVLQGQLSIAQQKQREYTEATKESTKMANQMRIDSLTRQIEGQTGALDILNASHGQLSKTAAKNLSIFARVAGQTADEFKTLWEEDADKAFEAFVKGLGDAGDDAIGILKDLGLQDQRLIKSFLSLAGAGDLLTQTLATGADAWEANAALAAEAELRYATTESQIAILKNVFRDFGVTVGDAFLPVIGEVIGVIRQLAEDNAPMLQQRVQALVQPLSELVTFFVRVIETGDSLNSALFAIGDKGLRALAKSIADLITGKVDLLELLGFSSEAIGVIQGTVAFIKQLAAVIGGIITGEIDILDSLGIKDVTIKIIEGLVKAFQFVRGALINIFTALKPVGVFFVALWESIKSVFLDTVWPQLKDAFSALVDMFGGLGIDLDVLEAVVTAVFAVIGGVITTAIAVAIGAITGFLAAVEVIANNLPGIIEGIKNVFQGIAEFIVGVMQTIVALVQGDFTAMTLAADRAVTALEKLIKDTFTLIGAIIKTVLDSVVVLVSTFVETVIEFFANLAEELIGNSIITDMLDAIVSAFTEFFQNALTLWNDFVSSIKNIVEALTIFVSEKFNSLVTNVSNSFATIKANVIQALADIKTAIEEAFVSIKEKWDAAWDSLVSSVTTKGAEILTEFKAAVAAIGTYLGEATVLADFVSWGKTIIETIASGISHNASVIKQKVGDAISNIQTKINNLGETLVSYGSQVIKKIAEGISQSAGDIVTEAVTAITAIGDFSDKLIGALKGVGAKIISHIVSGLSGGATALINEIRDMIEDAIEDVIGDIFVPNSVTINSISSSSLPQQSISPTVQTQQSGIIPQMSLGASGVIAPVSQTTSNVNTTTNNNFNLTTQTMASAGELELEFATLSMSTR